MTFDATHFYKKRRMTAYWLYVLFPLFSVASLLWIHGFTYSILGIWCFTSSVIIVKWGMGYATSHDDVDLHELERDMIFVHGLSFILSTTILLLTFIF